MTFYFYFVNSNLVKILQKDNMHFTIINKMSKKHKKNYFLKESQKIQAAAPGKWWQQVKSLSGTKNTEISGTFINVVQSEADGNYDLFVDKLNNFFIGISTSLPKLDYSPEPISNIQEFLLQKTM